MVDLPDDTVIVYSDYVCPFCYLGKESLERYRDAAEDPPPIEWRPFDLRARKRRPDGTIDESIDDGKDEAYYEQARHNVRRLKEEYGVEMTLDLSRDVDSWPAQKVSLAVQDRRDPAAFRAFHDAVFDALWKDGRDIGDPDVLVEIAEGVGIDEEVVREALRDDDLDDRLRERFREARSLGITGVPTFIYDGRAVPGAVPPDHLEALIGDG